MTARQVEKGKRGERQFCTAISQYLGEKIERELGAARNGGPDVRIAGRWAVEVKLHTEERRAEWWQQACQQADVRGDYPALAYRLPYQPWRVVVPLDLLMYGKSCWEKTFDLDWTATLSLAGFACLIGELTPPPLTP